MGLRHLWTPQYPIHTHLLKLTVGNSHSYPCGGEDEEGKDEESRKVEVVFLVLWVFFFTMAPLNSAMISGSPCFSYSAHEVGDGFIYIARTPDAALDFTTLHYDNMEMQLHFVSRLSFMLQAAPPASSKTDAIWSIHCTCLCKCPHC